MESLQINLDVGEALPGSHFSDKVRKFWIPFLLGIFFFLMILVPFVVFNMYVKNQ